MKQRVAIVQRAIEWQNVDANLKALEEVLEGVDVDVVVLSEMFQTGFVTEPQQVADDGATLDWMRMMAHRLDAAVVGSVVVEADGKYRNRS
jgi:predicted amidohydrolase